MKTIEPHILIVEDEGLIALDIERCLNQAGFESTSMASTGSEALMTLDKQPAELVLMDIMLDGKMDGIKTAEAIRTKYKLPIIFLTAYSDDKTVDEVKMIQPDGFITKPFKSKDLVSIVKIVLFKNQIQAKVGNEKDCEEIDLCPYCKSVMNEDNNEKWVSIEQFLLDKTRFCSNHFVCLTCIEKLKEHISKNLGDSPHYDNN